MGRVVLPPEGPLFASGVQHLAYVPSDDPGRPERHLGTALLRNICKNCAVHACCKLRACQTQIHNHLVRYFIIKAGGTGMDSVTVHVLYTSRH